MAVLKHDPIAADRSTIDHLLGLVLHALTEGLELELVYADADILD